MFGFTRDLQMAWRGFRKHPAAVGLAVFILAIGLGITTAAFQIVDVVFLRPMPYGNIGRLVVLYERHTRARDITRGTAPATWLDWKRQSRTFDRMSAFRVGEVNLTGRGEPQGAHAYYVSPDFFDTLGVKAMLGRAFAPDEDTPGRDAVAVLGFGLWKRLGSPADIVGATVRLDGRPHTVVGVMPTGLRYPTRGEIWLPLALTAAQANDRGSPDLTVFATLKAGATPEQARSEVDAIGRGIAERYPQTNRDWTMDGEYLRDSMRDSWAQQFSLVMLGAAAFVLLIVCVNVANLQLARALGRAKEVAVRQALGAGRARLIRQFLTESMLLCLAGGAAGLLVAEWALDLFVSSAPAEHALNIVGFERIGLDARASGFALVLSLICGLAAGILPALRTTRFAVNEALKENGRGASTGRSHRRLRGALVIAEVAVALVLAVGAASLARAFREYTTNLERLGPRSLLTMQLSVKGKQPREMAAFYRRVEERVRSLPGARTATVARSIPHGTLWRSVSFRVEGRPTPPVNEMPDAGYNAVSADFLRTMQLPLRAGRDLPALDNPAAPAALVSESFVRRYFPGENPIGRRIQTDSEGAPWLTIVGVGGDIWRGNNGKPPQPMIYQALEVEPPRRAFLAVRTAGDPAALAAGIRNLVAEVDPDQTVSDIKTLDLLATESNLGIIYVVGEMALFAGIALVLAMSGVYGVMAYAAGERRYEIGIRMAVGATRPDVLALVIGQGIRLAGAGILIGLTGALFVSRALSGLIFGVPGFDPMVLAGASAALGLAALAACYLPARRAASLEPGIALRGD